jgi:hypothetical protein
VDALSVYNDANNLSGIIRDFKKFASKEIAKILSKTLKVEETGC